MSNDKPLSAAVRELGWLTIPARVAPLDDLRVELAEIDENLMRAELTALEQGEHLARRSEILEALGERAQSGGLGRPRITGGIIPPVIKTTANIAGEMGISESSAHKRLQIARNLSPEVREAIAGPGMGIAVGAAGGPVADGGGVRTAVVCLCRRPPWADCQKCQETPSARTALDWPRTRARCFAVGRMVQARCALLRLDLAFSVQKRI